RRTWSAGTDACPDAGARGVVGTAVAVRVLTGSSRGARTPGQHGTSVPRPAPYAGTDRFRFHGSAAGPRRSDHTLSASALPGGLPRPVAPPQPSHVNTAGAGIARRPTWRLARRAPGRPGQRYHAVPPVRQGRVTCTHPVQDGRRHLR